MDISEKIITYRHKLKNSKNSLLTGSFWAISNNVIRLSTGLISIPLTIKYLGSERYGLWMLVISTLAYISFLDLGITPILKNNMSAAYARNDNSKLEFYISSSITVSIIILILIIPTSIAASSIDWISLLKISDTTAKEEILPLIITVQSISFLTLSLSSIDCIYSALMRIGILKFYDCLSSIIGFILLLISIKLC
jgi:O-antigen/teichoic acid export membrane protein